jgi:transcriptional regulator
MGREELEVLPGTLDLLILKTLHTMGPLHGWGIARRLEQIAAGKIYLNQGTVYPALLRMEQKGWIEASWGTTENNRRAKFYQLTADGEHQLGQQEEAWRAWQDLVDRVLEGGLGEASA